MDYSEYFDEHGSPSTKWYDESIATVEESNELMTELQNEIRKKTKLLHLVQQEKLKNIKDTIGRNIVCIQLCSFCKDYYSNKNDTKLIRQFVETLNSLFERNDICLDEVMVEGYSNYAWSISFYIPEKGRFCLQVPVAENLTFDDLLYTSDGKISLSKVEDCVINQQAASYKFEDIKECLNKLASRESAASVERN